VILSLALLVAAVAARAATINRHVRGRLFVSAVAFGADAVAAGVAAYAPLSPEFAHEELAFVSPLLLAFGLTNALVALGLNPWREDRLPDRFPTIVQDAVMIALFAVAATVVLQERILATTAVGAVVVGLALQDTLGNLFAGLAIQVEKPFRVGQWVRVHGTDGIVTEITWRATKLRTKAGNFIVVPNTALSKDTITNYSEPDRDTRLEVQVGASYDSPPNEVKAAILDALRHEPLVANGRAPEVLVVDFGAYAITYLIRVWTNDFATDDRVVDRVRTVVYYAFRRRGIVIPYPVEVQIPGVPAPPVPLRDEANEAAVFDGVAIFAALEPAEHAELRRAARAVVYAAGETIVQQGDCGSSMFVMIDGEAKVTIDPAGQEVARFARGGFFGEMSLLTGEPRAATVSAVSDCHVIEITADAFRRCVLDDPEAVEHVGLAVAKRASELAKLRAAGESAPRDVEPSTSLIDRMRRFLRIMP
jgi:small-conductance mechanosensitive channel